MIAYIGFKQLASSLHFLQEEMLLCSAKCFIKNKVEGLMKILVTGGAGFIGSALIRHVIESTNYSVINIDKLTYAGNLDSLSAITENDRYSFVQVDICDKGAVERVLNSYQPTCIMHLAAESHVDRSIDSPD